jgi:hypothetical protein
MRSGTVQLLLSVSSQRDVWPMRNTVLARAGYAVTPARSLEEELRRLDERRYAAAVLGHSFSADEKREFIAQAGRQNPVPVVCIALAVPCGCQADREIASQDGPERLLEAISAVAR